MIKIIKFSKETIENIRKISAVVVDIFIVILLLYVGVTIIMKTGVPIIFLIIALVIRGQIGDIPWPYTIDDEEEI
jgi:hypothetical protein